MYFREPLEVVYHYTLHYSLRYFIYGRWIDLFNVGFGNIHYNNVNVFKLNIETDILYNVSPDSHNWNISMSMFLDSLNIDINVFDDVATNIQPLKTQWFQRLVLLTRYYKSSSCMINSLRQVNLLIFSLLWLQNSQMLYIFLFSLLFTVKYNSILRYVNIWIWIVCIFILKLGKLFYWRRKIVGQHIFIILESKE